MKDRLKSVAERIGNLERRVAPSMMRGEGVAQV